MNLAANLITAGIPQRLSPIREKMRSWLRGFVLVSAAVALGVGAAKMRNLDPVVKTDPVTGCQYLQFGMFGSQAVPRLDRSGRPICRQVPGGPIRHRI